MRDLHGSTSRLQQYAHPVSKSCIGLLAWFRTSLSRAAACAAWDVFELVRTPVLAPSSLDACMTICSQGDYCMPMQRCHAVYICYPLLQASSSALSCMNYIRYEHAHLRHAAQTSRPCLKHEGPVGSIVRVQPMCSLRACICVGCRACLHIIDKVCTQLWQDGSDQAQSKTSRSCVWNTSRASSASLCDPQAAWWARGHTSLHPHNKAGPVFSCVSNEPRTAADMGRI